MQQNPLKKLGIAISIAAGLHSCVLDSTPLDRILSEEMSFRALIPKVH